MVTKHKDQLWPNASALSVNRRIQMINRDGKGGLVLIHDAMCSVNSLEHGQNRSFEHAM